MIRNEYGRRLTLVCLWLEVIASRGLSIPGAEFQISSGAQEWMLGELVQQAVKGMIVPGSSGLFILRSQLRLRRAFASRCFSTKPYEPLRILFCGSDEFSIASLKALHEEHLRRPDSIASIDVVCRPGKRVGRGLKKIREGSHPLHRYS